MVMIEDTVWCDGCGVEILWGPVTIGAHQYCCPDCQYGWTCRCGERMDLENGPRMRKISQSGFLTTQILLNS